MASIGGDLAEYDWDDFGVGACGRWVHGLGTGNEDESALLDESVSFAKHATTYVRLVIHNQPWLQHNRAAGPGSTA
jgi:hypothetical protein